MTLVPRMHFFLSTFLAIFSTTTLTLPPPRRVKFACSGAPPSPSPRGKERAFFGDLFFFVADTTLSSEFKPSGLRCAWALRPREYVQHELGKLGFGCKGSISILGSLPMPPRKMYPYSCDPICMLSRCPLHQRLVGMPGHGTWVLARLASKQLGKGS